MKRLIVVLLGVLAAALVLDSATALAAPIFMPALGELHKSALQPPPVSLPPVCAPSPTDVCVPYNPPPAGEPAPVNMAYFGGHVQVKPKVYLVLWGWGQKGAFDHKVAGRPTSDPDGAGARMAAFIKAMGGTEWTGSQTQYYQLVNGWKQHIDNPTNQYGGTWWDNTNPIKNNVSGLNLAQEAARAVKHFGVKDLKNSQFVIAQPQKFNEQGFNDGVGYCAWHDYTQPQYYPGVQPGISFTNMPYVLNQGSGCGQESVNAAPAGDLDGFTIVMGHEIEETVTDPGAEDVINGQNLGAWYDYGGYENADKCAWVGDIGITGASASVPGGMANIRGNDGKLYPVQSLWSNDAAGGTGYCAGNGNDLPA